MFTFRSRCSITLCTREAENAPARKRFPPFCTFAFHNVIISLHYDYLRDMCITITHIQNIDIH